MQFHVLNFFASFSG